MIQNPDCACWICRKVEFDELLTTSDVISLNLPLSDKTRGMFDKETIGRMKKGAFLVNTARGGIVDRDSVVEAVKSGHLAGYAGDVLCALAALSCVGDLHLLSQFQGQLCGAMGFSKVNSKDKKLLICCQEIKRHAR